MGRCVAHKNKVPTTKVKVTIKSEVKLCLKLCCSETTEANWMKRHRKIKHNEYRCCAQDLGFYPQGQGHNEVTGKIVSQQ